MKPPTYHIFSKTCVGSVVGPCPRGQRECVECHPGTSNGTEGRLNVLWYNYGQCANCRVRDIFPLRFLKRNCRVWLPQNIDNKVRSCGSDGPAVLNFTKREYMDYRLKANAQKYDWWPQLCRLKFSATRYASDSDGDYTNAYSAERNKKYDLIKNFIDI